MSLDLISNLDEINLSLVKPFARSVYEFEDFRLDAEHLMLYRNGAETPLTPKQVETLLALVGQCGEIVSKKVLMTRLWGTTSVEESNLIQNIHFLRKVLGDTADGRQMIETRRRRGYRFNGKLKEREPGVLQRAEFRPQLVRAESGLVENRGVRRSVVGLCLMAVVVIAAAAAYLLFVRPSPVEKKYFAVLPLKPIDPANHLELYEIGIA